MLRNNVNVLLTTAYNMDWYRSWIEHPYAYINRTHFHGICIHIQTFCDWQVQSSRGKKARYSIPTRTSWYLGNDHKTPEIANCIEWVYISEWHFGSGNRYIYTCIVHDNRVCTPNGPQTLHYNDNIPFWQGTFLLSKKRQHWTFSSLEWQTQNLKKTFAMFIINLKTQLKLSHNKLKFVVKT